jgi:endonuclease/exonuclease/phosphatase family metal-dependent hydrolase
MTSTTSGKRIKVFWVFFSKKNGPSFLKKRSKKLLLSVVLAFATRAFAGEVKVSTWNLNWLTQRSRVEGELPLDVHPRAAEDFVRLAGYARKLDADVVAFQEVDGTQTAALIFDPAVYAIATIDEPVVQRVGIAVRRTWHIGKNPDLVGLDAEPHEKFRLRYGLDVTLIPPAGAALRVLVVHLKTGCQTDSLATSRRAQCALLARQIPPIAGWIAARRAEGIGFIVLGDFNRVFDTPDDVGTALARAAPLLRVTQGFENPCWDGAPFIDHIFLGGPARNWLVPGSLRVQVFHEVGDSWKAKLSDHCPVSVRLHLPG